MKILWLSHLIPYPPKGGVLQRSYNLIRETSKYHDVTLLAFIQNDLMRTRFSSIDSGVEESLNHLGEFCNDIKYIKIPCEHSRFGKYHLALKSLFTTDGYTINWLKSGEMQSAIQLMKNKHQFDLIHFDTISLAPYISEFPQIPKALDHHNIESHMMLRRSAQESNPLKRFYFYLEGKKLLNYEKKVCSKFNLHLTCSTLDTDRLNEIDPSLDIQEIPNGVDVDYFFPCRENETKKHLIFAGSLNWYPNKDAMLFFINDIWPLLKESVPDIVMNIVGSSPPAELLKLASIDPQLKVHGFVDDVREYISSASIYVCPIRDGGGTKLKILDSFAMGMATVAHPTACEGIAVVDGTNVLLASTPDEFIEKIQLLINNDDLRITLGKNARQTAIEKYSYTSIGEKLSQQYLRIIDTI